MRAKEKKKEFLNYENGAEAEAGGDVERAIALYEKNIKRNVADSFTYQRLMVLYRKQKRYKDELRVIYKGIEVFTARVEKEQQRMMKRIKNKSQLKKLSTVFGKRTGLMNKKGNDLYLPAPVEQWLKRKETVESKLKKIN
jgi:hypothetical protein